MIEIRTFAEPMGLRRTVRLRWSPGSGTEASDSPTDDGLEPVTGSPHSVVVVQIHSL
jgi:hypothetical protein